MVTPPAAGPVQTSESSPVRDRRSTTEPPNQPTNYAVWTRRATEQTNFHTNWLLELSQPNCTKYQIVTLTMTQPLMPKPQSSRNTKSHRLTSMTQSLDNRININTMQ